jgi:hypothetical protein
MKKKWKVFVVSSINIQIKLKGEFEEYNGYKEETRWKIN